MRKMHLMTLRGISLMTACWIAGCASSGRAPTVSPVSLATGTPGCVASTGSRIADPQGCAGEGRSYSQEDIARTGQTTAGGALALLDPALTVHR